MAKSKSSVAVAERKSERDEQKFTKQQILSAARYKNRKDMVSALLDDGKTYTITEVDQMVDQIMKGKVK